MTKEELHRKLCAGKTMDELFHFQVGQECLIHKANTFTTGKEIIYIPDIDLNSVPKDRPLNGKEEIEEVLSLCYTGDDFVEECEGNVELAKCLFDYCDWQHPSSALPEIVDETGDGDTASSKIEITIFQAPYTCLLEHGLYLKMYDANNPYNGVVPAEYYLPVFKGNIDYIGQLPENQTERDYLVLERAFSIFNVARPASYCGRSMSVGDIVRLEDRYYLCAVEGFTEVEFKTGARETGIPGTLSCELPLPSGIRLRASVHPESEYPCINIDLIHGDGDPVRICFAEHNPERAPGQQLCIGVYCSSEEDTVYYGSYNTNGNMPE